MGFDTASVQQEQEQEKGLLIVHLENSEAKHEREESKVEFEFHRNDKEVDAKYLYNSFLGLQ
jgi:hypothetical protein